jgi:hypothetical protein
VDELLPSEIGKDILLFSGVLSDFQWVLEFSKTIAWDEMDISQMKARTGDYFKDDSSRPQIFWLPKGGTVDEVIHEGVGAVIRGLVGVYGNPGVAQDCGYRFNKYPAGRGYKLHVDRSNGTPELRNRYISVIIGLNDDYEGGLIRFPRQGVEHKLKANEALVFPSSYTHPHEVDAVTQGDRYNIVTWLT